MIIINLLKTKEFLWNVLIVSIHFLIVKSYHCLKVLIKQKKIARCAINHLLEAKVQKLAQVLVAQRHIESEKQPRFTKARRNALPNAHITKKFYSLFILGIKFLHNIAPFLFAYITNLTKLFLWFVLYLFHALSCKTDHSN